MLKQNLLDNWSVRAVGDVSEVPSEIRDQSFPAKVPGCVHTDLLRAGKIPDPYLGLNEYKLQWIGKTDWEYRTTFDADAKLFDHERIDLVFDGLDTIARIELNGTLIAETQNMHRSYRFDVRKHLKRGTNELRVTFASAVEYAFAMREKLGPRPWVNGAGGPFNFIRKMACNFGWDWGPVLVTCGMWRPVRLEGWSHLRISKVVPSVTHCDSQSALVAVRVEIEGDASDRCDLGVTIAAARSRGTGVPPVHSRLAPQSHARDAHATEYQHANPMVANPAGFADRTGEGDVIVKIDNPEMWQPTGHGMQARYELIVEAHDFSSTDAHDVSYLKIGLRTVELDTAADSIGSKFVLKVNGKPIFCKGFNWIPDDCFLDRACDPARVRKRIQQAVDAGANMLRIWGGGIYETDDLYNICDELGVMVWQDFPFACAMYPEEEPFRSEVEAEARENVARLSSHPSLVLWNGNNENLWAYRDWGWKDQVIGKTWGKNYYLDLLPRIVKELDPSRPYWAASPWSGDRDVDNGIHPNDPNHGNMHVWGPWFKDDYDTYRRSAPRFCSEFGFQAPANFATIVRSIGKAHESPFSPCAHAGSNAEREKRSRDEPRIGAGAKQESAASLALDFGAIEMRHRQKSGNVHDDGDLRNLRHLARHFRLDGVDELTASLTIPDPKPPLPAPGTVQPLHTASKPSNLNFDDLHFLLQLNQCRALTLGVEWFRSRQPTCMGTLYWQLNDCWPVTSWSCIDGDGRLKPLWYATRRFYAPRLLTIQPANDQYEIGNPLWLFAINDTDEPWAYTTRVTLEDFLGIPISESIVKFNVPPRSVASQKLGQEIVTPLVEARSEMIVVHGDAPALWFFGPDKWLRYPSAYCEVDVQSAGEEHRVTLRSLHLVRDIILAVDRIDPDATIDDNCITLLPNESKTMTIRCKGPIEAKTLMSPPVFQCANRFGAFKLSDDSEER